LYSTTLSPHYASFIGASWGVEREFFFFLFCSQRGEEEKKEGEEKKKMLDVLFLFLCDQ